MVMVAVGPSCLNTLNRAKLVVFSAYRRKVCVSQKSLRVAEKSAYRRKVCESQKSLRIAEFGPTTRVRRHNTVNAV